MASGHQRCDCDEIKGRCDHLAEAERGEMGNTIQRFGPLGVTKYVFPLSLLFCAWGVFLAPLSDSGGIVDQSVRARPRSRDAALLALLPIRGDTYFS